MIGLAAALGALAGCGGDAAGGGGRLPPDPCTAAGTCPPGVWVDVTPASMSRMILSPTENAYGPGSVVADPARPSDLYIGGGGDGIWRSQDYGNSWTRIDDTIPGVAHGDVIAVAGTTPATIWAAAGGNTGRVFRSVDGGATFTLTGNGGFGSDLYSMTVDPHDPMHLISGLHEADGIVETTDGGDTWRLVGGSGFPAGGVSWYPFFVEMGDAAATRRTWFAIAQGGGSATMTGDGGATWRIPTGLDGLQHPHGNAQIFQDGATLFAGGIYGPGQGVYRSTDRGATWTRVSGDASVAVVWGTAANVYSMWSWACSNCDLGTGFMSAPKPGTDWSTQTSPTDLHIGASRVAVTNDGTHAIFVGVM